MKLKIELISAPIISAPDWSKPFEIMCDVFDFAIGAILGQPIDNKQYVIYYSSRTLNDAQLNYTTTEKEFLAVVFAWKKFVHTYLAPKPPYSQTILHFDTQCSKRTRRPDSFVGFSSSKSLISKFKIKRVSKMSSPIISLVFQRPFQRVTNQW